MNRMHIVRRSRLWAPQELYLIMFATVGEWRRWLLRTVFAESLVGAVSELLGTGATDAQELVRSWPDTMPMRDVYLFLQEHCAPALLCDKTPMNADHPGFIRQAIRGWEMSRFVHLFRHPVPAIQSLVELNRNVGLVQGMVTDKYNPVENFRHAEYAALGDCMRASNAGGDRRG